MQTILLRSPKHLLAWLLTHVPGPICSSQTMCRCSRPWSRTQIWLAGKDWSSNFFAFRSLFLSFSLSLFLSLSLSLSLSHTHTHTHTHTCTHARMHAWTPQEVKLWMKEKLRPTMCCFERSVVSLGALLGPLGQRQSKEPMPSDASFFFHKDAIDSTLLSCLCVCLCLCLFCRCVCHNEKSARRMASMTSNTNDTSSKLQQAQRKENYNKRKRPVSSVDHCHPYRRKKRREAVY